MPENDAQTKVRVDPQGRMVIPAKFRKLLEIERGDTLLASFHEGQLVLEKAGTIMRRLKQRFFRLPQGKSLAEELLAERRAEERRENDG